jgi:short-subunit dehydrogenase
LKRQAAVNLLYQQPTVTILCRNVKAVVCVSKMVAKAMIEGGKGGVIINVSSLVSIP